MPLHLWRLNSHDNLTTEILSHSFTTHYTILYLHQHLRPHNEVLAKLNIIDISIIFDSIKILMSYIEEIEQLFRLIKSGKKSKLQQSGIDMTVEQWVILEQLKQTPGITQKQLAKETEKDPAAIMRTLNLLELREVVQRKNPPGNKRDHNIFLTEKGKALLHKLWPTSIDIRAQGTKGLTADEMKAFLRILAAMKENFGGMLKFD